MNANDILKELEKLGSAGTKKVLMNHGAREPCFGVKIGDLKKIQKRVKTDHQLALDLYASGNYDAMYLAGLVADDARMTKPDLQRWAKQAYGGSLPGYTVPWVAAGSPHGWALACEWIDSGKAMIAAIGWATLSSLVALKPDADLDLPALRKLLQRVRKEIHGSPNEVRSTMNLFVISVGCYVAPLKDAAMQAGEAIGPVQVDYGDTACQTPFAPEYIRKIEARGSIGKKRKTVKC